MNLPIIRPAKIADLPHLINFAQTSGHGITSLPYNPEVLERKLHDSERSFEERLPSSTHETYVFCLEYEGVVAGTSAIVSHIGITEPFFTYHVRTEHLRCPHLKIDRRALVLHFTQARRSPTEIGTLFLEPSFRRRDWGKLLSFSRFLFIAQFRKRFASLVIAELRGINHNGHSPFWEAIGRPFFQLEFSQADHLRTMSPVCLEEIFPKHPIYTDLLPLQAQEVIGKTHPDTEPAQKILFHQGFKPSHYIDIFDAGPHLFAPTDEIDAIRSSKTAPATIRSQLGATLSTFLANTRLDFRATLAQIALEGNQAILHPETAHALQVNEGDLIRYYEF